MIDANKLPGLQSQKIPLVLKMFEEGKTAQEISDQLRVKLAVIESFGPKVEAKPVTRPARTRQTRVKPVDNVDNEFTGEGEVDGPADL